MPGSAATPASHRRGFVDIRWFDEVDSTNLRLAEVARAGATNACDTVIVANHQTHGRGRRGRTWESPPGASLLVSVVLAAPAPELAQLTTVCAALGAADACDETGGIRPSLKWPNDLMVGDAKLGGILAEAVTSRLVIVGLGLNVDWGDEPMPEGATSLAKLTAGPGTGVGQTFQTALSGVLSIESAGSARKRAVPKLGEDANPALAALLVSYLHLLDSRSRALGVSNGRRRLLDDYRQACSTVGRAVTVDLGGDVRLVGIATGITDSGSLVVETVDGIREVSAGDVVHLREQLPG